MDFQTTETLNGHAIGIIMKELVRRAISVIQSERLAYEVNQKQGYGGQMDDVVTSADKKAQEVYVRSLRECFPSYGIISEEGVNEPGDTYFTIDPLDGTKAFVRGQSHGVGTMIALVHQGKVVAAYVGDVNTGEIFGYRPDSENVHRITRLELFQKLPSHGFPTSPLSDGYAILRDPPELGYSQAITPSIKLFKNYLVDGGSIGTWLARLWKREVVAAFLPSGYQTPWDETPIIGITERLGYAFFEHQNGEWVRTFPVPQKTIVERKNDLLIIHENQSLEFLVVMDPAIQYIREKESP